MISHWSRFGEPGTGWDESNTPLSATRQVPVRRRLTAILAAVALASILLVGAGVLALGTIGAREEAEAAVAAQLEAVNELSEGTRVQDLRDFGQILQRSRRAFSETSLTPVLVVDGQVIPTQRTRGPDQLGAAIIGAHLSPEQQEAFDVGDTVLVESDGAVIGLQMLGSRRFTIPTELSTNGDVSVAVLARREISALPSGVVGWFLGSSVVVLAGAVLAGRTLAGRFVRPIQQIELTTATLARGQLEARTSVSGNDELAQLANSVNTMAEQLQTAKDRDRQFLMSVSHDLRTPLTAISGYAEALVDQPDNLSAADHADVAAIGRVISDHADRLERLVTELLDLARLDSNQFTFNITTVDLRVVVGRAVAGMANLAEQADVSLTQRNPISEQATKSESTAVPLLVDADADRLIQIVENLVANAVRFAESAVVVDVNVVGKAAELVVTNDGPAIAADDLPYVFDRLYVGKAASDSGRANTGLGLAIVKELTESMNGVVAAYSGSDSGRATTSFSVRMPLSAVPTHPTD